MVRKVEGSTCFYLPLWSQYMCQLCRLLRPTKQGCPAAKLPLSFVKPTLPKTTLTPEFFFGAAHINTLQDSYSVTHLGKHWHHCLLQEVPHQGSSATTIVLGWEYFHYNNYYTIF